METCTFTIQVERREDALPRLLGLADRKGLRVRACVARRSADDRRLEVRLTVEGAVREREAAELLRRGA